MLELFTQESRYAFPQTDTPHFNRCLAAVKKPRYFIPLQAN